MRTIHWSISSTIYLKAIKSQIKNNAVFILLCDSCIWAVRRVEHETDVNVLLALSVGLCGEMLWSCVLLEQLSRECGSSSSCNTLFYYEHTKQTVPQITAMEKHSYCGGDSVMGLWTRNAFCTDCTKSSQLKLDLYDKKNTINLCRCTLNGRLAKQLQELTILHRVGWKYCHLRLLRPQVFVYFL